MKKVLLTLLALCIVSSSAFAYKVYSYDNKGNRVYSSSMNDLSRIKPFKSQNTTIFNNSNSLNKSPRHIPRQYNTRTHVYDANGNRVKTYVQRPSGRTYVYDNAGNKLGSIKTYPSRQPYYNNFASPYGSRVQYGTNIFNRF